MSRVVSRIDPADEAAAMRARADYYEMQAGYAPPEQAREHRALAARLRRMAREIEAAASPGAKSG